MRDHHDGPGNAREIGREKLQYPRVQPDTKNYLSEIDPG